MRSRLLAVTVEARDPAEPARFWAGILGRDLVEDAGGVLLPGGDAQLGLRFVPGRAGQLGANRMHLHLTSADLEGHGYSLPPSSAPLPTGTTTAAGGSSSASRISSAIAP